MSDVYKVGCNTLVRTEEDGTKVYKDKKKFDSLDDAIEACKKVNAQPHRISKLVSYKCKCCHKYHIGRNGKTITDKYRNKLSAESYEPTPEEIEKRKKNIRMVDIENADFKIVGKIDLSKIPKK
jgi:Ser-tRNA(Ala) deacylase AlaX